MNKLAHILTKIIDFFYPPFRKVMSEQLFRYAACGGGNLVLDWILYFLVYNFVIGHELVYISLPFREGVGVGSFCITPHIASLCIVFPITLLTGFWLQKNVTFSSSNLHSVRQLGRYIVIVMINLAINYFGLKLCGAVFVGWIYYIKELLRLKEHLRKQGEQVKPYIDKAKSYLDSEDIKAQRDVLVRKGEETMDNIRKKLQSDS